MLKSICKFIQSEDKNSDIMEAYEEMLDGELDKDSLVLTCQMILGDWKEDLEQEMTPKLKGYYDYLGI